MNFQISPQDEQLRQRSRRLAQGFAARAAEHDRAASHPLENYAALRREGFYGLNIPQDMGGEGVGLLGYSLAAEQLAQGWPLDRAVLQYARVDCGAAVREPGRLAGNQRLSRRSGGQTTQIDRREFLRAQQFRPAGHL